MNYVGIGCTNHKDYDSCGVINYAENYKDNPGIKT